MDLFEFQAKALFRQKGIPVPLGETASTPAHARGLAAQYGAPVAVKAQVLTGGRGKAGGIKVAADPDAAEAAAAAILGMDIKGHTVRQVLVEAAADIAQEIYLGILIDRETQRLMVMASAEGGVEIEEVAARTPEKIRRAYADPLLGWRRYQGLGLAKALGLAPRVWPGFAAVTAQLFDAAVHFDADLAEINPLILDAQNQFVALDGKVSIDDNALPRQDALMPEEEGAGRHPLEAEARAAGLNFVYLGGNVACLGNGAGLAMATMDAVQYFGGQPANFLDIGGGASIAQVTAAVRIMTSDPAVQSLLVNVSGGITRCDEVAEGLAAAIRQADVAIPLVVRLVGTNEEEARAVLAPFHVNFVQTFTEAAQRAVAAARRDDS